MRFTIPIKSRVSFARGEIFLVSMVFSNQTGTKRRPVMVVHDGDDQDLLVIPVTSHASRSRYDGPVLEWQRAVLRVPSVIRAEKLASIAKTSLIRRLGYISAKDLANVDAALNQLFRAILTNASVSVRPERSA